MLVELDRMLDAIWSQGKQPTLIVMSENRWWEFSTQMQKMHQLAPGMGDVATPTLRYAGYRIVVDCMSVGQMFVV